eukprot:scaffold27365_cov118-Isochrysis_galbana.AAC.1
MHNAVVGRAEQRTEAFSSYFFVPQTLFFLISYTTHSYSSPSSPRIPCCDARRSARERARHTNVNCVQRYWGYFEFFCSMYTYISPGQATAPHCPALGLMHWAGGPF